jgi:small subunit ribosomal protein S9
MAEAQYFQAVGRRKEAVARVRLVRGQGILTVNGKPVAVYFPSLVEQKAYQRPFEVTETLGHFTGSVKVIGGGRQAQLYAMIHGIARALEKANKEKYRPSLKSAGLLTRDARARERRKVGQGGRARAKKQSPKR